ncbi:unnamed protein product [Symbiodinium sp. CCMP2592]|nr:unnamed protein product [Symbiodinium sp. CCMP2592]
MQLRIQTGTVGDVLGKCEEIKVPEVVWLINSLDEDGELALFENLKDDDDMFAGLNETLASLSQCFEEQTRRTKAQIAGSKLASISSSKKDILLVARETDQ